MFKIAVTGRTGTGKSIVNSIRGMRNDDVAAAPVGILDTIKENVNYSQNKNLLIYVSSQYR